MPAEGRKISQLTPASSIADTDVLAKENASGTSTEAVTAAQLAEYAKRKGIQVDNTLSTPGAAADAAKTGEEITDLKNKLNPFAHVIRFESGSFGSDHKTKLDNNTRIRNESPVPLRIVRSLAPPTGYTWYLFFFDADMNYLSASQAAFNYTSLPANYVYANIQLSKNNSETADISEYVSAVQSGVSVVWRDDYSDQRENTLETNINTNSENISLLEDRIDENEEYIDHPGLSLITENSGNFNVSFTADTPYPNRSYTFSGSINTPSASEIPITENKNVFLWASIFASNSAKISKASIRVYFFAGSTRTGDTDLGSNNAAFTTPSGCTGITLRASINASVPISTDFTDTITYKYKLLLPVEYNNCERAELKVCTYNIGMLNFGLNAGESPLHPRLYVDDKFVAVKEFLAENSFDVIGCQENSDVIGTDGSLYSTVFLGAYEYQYVGNFVLTLSSRYPLYNQKTGYFTAKVDDNSRGWQMAEIYVDGKKIALFNCHLAWQNTPEAVEVRLAQKREIITMLASYEFAILFGDWNAYSGDEYDVFTSAGYTIANGGYLPFKNTNFANNSPTVDQTLLYPLDNVIIKSKGKAFGKVAEALTVKEKPVPSDERDLYVSDHLPFMANLLL